MEGIGEVVEGAAAGGGEVAVDVLDCAAEDVEAVVESVELVAGDHELVFAELEFVSTVAGDPVPLPAARRAEHPRAPGTAPFGQRASAPPTTVRFPGPLLHG